MSLCRQRFPWQGWPAEHFHLNPIVYEVDKDYPTVNLLKNIRDAMGTA
jgi:hypothetical protein